MRLAELLQAHWPDYVARAQGPIPSRHWRAVEAVLRCHTERCGGHVHACTKCQRTHYVYHSCNHRSCPGCGGRAQKQWALNQQAKLLSVPYFLVTLTVPDSLRAAFAFAPAELYPLFFAQSAAAMQTVFAHKKWLGGQAGFVAVLHTWTRQMQLHPHLHLLVPAVALSADGCELRHPNTEEFLVPVRVLGRALREGVKSALSGRYPELFSDVPAKVWQQDWVVHCQPAGRGRSALCYLAAYVQKTAFSEERLLGYDQAGRVLLRWKDSTDGQWKVEALEPLELIRRWLLHVLPKGLVRVRHYGWLGSAAKRAFFRVRFLLGMRAYRKPKLVEKEPLRSACCKAVLLLIGRLRPMRGPPLSRQILKR